MRLPQKPDVQELRAWLGAFELWFTKATRIAIVMARGAYWLGERKRLLTQLGNQTYEQLRKNQVDPVALQPVVDQIGKLGEKLELEEARIQALRTGETP